jgi:hypothetical protein
VHTYLEASFFFTSSCPHFWSIGLISQFLDHSQTVGLLRRVISSSQGLYLNAGQHKHRKMHTHIKHPCPELDSNPQFRLPSERIEACNVLYIVDYWKIIKRSRNITVYNVGYEVISAYCCFSQGAWEQLIFCYICKPYHSSAEWR